MSLSRKRWGTQEQWVNLLRKQLGCSLRAAAWQFKTLTALGELVRVGDRGGYWPTDIYELREERRGEEEQGARQA